MHGLIARIHQVVLPSLVAWAICLFSEARPAAVCWLTMEVRVSSWLFTPSFCWLSWLAMELNRLLRSWALPNNRSRGRRITRRRSALQRGEEVAERGGNAGAFIRQQFVDRADLVQIGLGVAIERRGGLQLGVREVGRLTRRTSASVVPVPIKTPPTCCEPAVPCTICWRE